MLKANKLHIIGIGYRPLGARARDIILGAGVILASNRLVDVFTRYAEHEAVKDRVKVINNVPETVEFLRHELRTAKSELRTIVLLASGDPLFFGIGRRMVEEFGKERIDIIPDLSSMQAAFARINEPWDDAFSISVHGGPDIARRRKLPYEISDIPRLLDQHGKLAVLTDRQNNPAEIAKEIRSALSVSPSPNPLPPGEKEENEGRSAIIMHVCERLGYPDERIWSGTVSEAADMNFGEPNVVIVMRKSPIEDTGCMIHDGEKRASCIVHHASRFGLCEDDILHSRGLITKDEVRAVTLHKLNLPESGVLWDIGAGSGSISIEAARLAPHLRVIALEKDEEQVNHITTNIRRFGVKNIKVTKGAAPEELDGLPAPDRVFIGGSGGRLGAIVKCAGGKMSSGIMVINAATLETLQESIAALEQSGFVTDVSEVSVSRSKIVGGKKLMSAMNPIFIIKGERG